MIHLYFILSMYHNKFVQRCYLFVRCMTALYKLIFGSSLVAVWDIFISVFIIFYFSIVIRIMTSTPWLNCPRQSCGKIWLIFLWSVIRVRVLFPFSINICRIFLGSFIRNGFFFPDQHTHVTLKGFSPKLLKLLLHIIQSGGRTAESSTRFNVTNNCRAIALFRKRRNKGKVIFFCDLTANTQCWTSAALSS